MSSILKFKSLLFLILVPFLLVLIWFKSGLIVGGGEEGLAFYNPTRTLELSKVIWWDYNGGFPTLAWLSKISSLIPTAFFYQSLNFPNFLLQAGTFFILMAVGEISVYLLTLFFLGKSSSNNIIAFVAALFYLLNPFSISQIWTRGLASQYFSFALLPLSILLFLKGINGQYIYLFYLTFASFLFSTAFGISTFVITYWVILTATLIYYFFAHNRNLKQFLDGIFFYVLAIILFFLVHAWWFLSTVLSGNKIYVGYLENAQENIGTLLGVSRNFTPDVIIRLLQKTYFFDAGFNPAIYSSIIFQLISLLIPVFLLVGLFFVSKKKELKGFRFFVILFIIGLIISLGANPPLGWLFVWIFKHVPFLQSFRNPYEKFGLVYALGYSPIFAVGLVYFFDKFFKVNGIKLLGLFTILILICVIYAWPMWIGRVVAGPDRKVGIPVPDYYMKLQRFLNDKGESYRAFLTPLWGGDGAFYDWGGTRYQGLDPTIYLLDTPTVSSSPRYLYFYDFMQNIRRYKERINLAPALALLRAKYLVDRGDSIMITDSEKQYRKFLTESIYPPLGVTLTAQTVCQNQITNSQTNEVAWLICKLPKDLGDWSNTRYFHATIKTDIPADLEIAIRDSKEIRIRWDGRVAPQFQTKNNGWTQITAALSAPTEYNSEIDFSKIYLVEVLAHPKGFPQESVKEISLKDIKLDPGEEENINEFKLVETFDKLQIYEPLHFNSPPEFGSLSDLEKVLDFVQLFETVSKGRDQIDKRGFILESQNSGKDLQNFPTNSAAVVEKTKISQARYWLKVNEGTSSAFLILSQNFNPQWKVISGINKEKIAGSFFDDLDILKSKVVPEDNHLVVNGYANLWKVDGQDRQYAIVFMPQIIADIGSKISIVSLLVLFPLTIVWVVKKYTSLY